MSLAVSLVGEENGDAVYLWKGDSQEHISSAMNTIILLYLYMNLYSPIKLTATHQQNTGTEKRKKKKKQHKKHNYQLYNVQLYNCS